jgi:tetratricopeptide (TPR) repeat protein
MVPTYSPLEAYRRDVARLGPTETFGPNDGEWLAASLALQRYADAPPSERPKLAHELARHLAVGDELTACNAGLRIARVIERSGALNLSVSWLALLERIIPPSSVVETGRILSQRANVVCKFGEFEQGHALYTEVEALGRRHAEPELTARAWLGYGLIAQARGNYPEARRWFTGSALVADDNGCKEAGFRAHISLMTCASMAREWNVAMREGWVAYRLADGDPQLEAMVLVNIAQALHDRGEYRASLHGFACAVARATFPDTLFPALGGVALSAARLGKIDVVHAAARYLEKSAGATWDYVLASALIDLRDAHLILGRPGDAGGYGDRAMRIAVARGFHEMTHRIANPAITRPAPAAPLDREARRIVQDLERIEPPAELRVLA